MKWNFRKTYKKMPPAVRSSLWFSICNFMQRGIALITIPVFTRLLTTKEYGVCNVYFAWAEMILVFTSLQIPYEGLNNGLIRYEKDKDGYTSAMAGLILVMTVLGAGIYFLIHSWLDPVMGLNPMLIGLMFVQLLFNPMLMLWMNRERFDFHYRMPAAVMLLNTVLNPILSILLVLHTPLRAEARVIGSVAGQSFLGFLVLLILFRKGRTFYCKEYWKFAVSFNLPLLFYYLSQLVLNQSDRVMINYYEGSGKAAVYSMAYTAAAIIKLLVSAINGSFMPWIYRKLKKKSYHEIRQLVSILCLIIAAGTLAVSAFAPDLIRIMATKEYSEAIWIIPPVSASVFFIFLYTLFAGMEMYYDENKGIPFISVICSSANLLLNAVFIPRYGYMAAGWTTLVCYAAMTVFHSLLLRNVFRKKEIQDPPVSAKLLLAVSFGVLVMTFLILGIYRLGSFRYLIPVLESGILFVFRKKLLLIMQRKEGADTGENEAGEQ
ncbi:MAG: lipopolysaccharide biosynthesis protein [Lachnospiraceae bacterium]